MLYILYFVINLVQLILSFLQLALFLSALISWFPAFDEGSVFAQLLYRITEPLLYPARLLVSKSEMFSSLPIDMSYIITFFGLSIIGSLLSSIVF